MATSKTGPSTRSGFCLLWVVFKAAGIDEYKKKPPWYFVTLYLPILRFHLVLLQGNIKMDSLLFFSPPFKMVCSVQLNGIFSWEQADDRFHRPEFRLFLQHHPAKWKTETKHFNHMCIKYTGLIKHDLKLHVCFGGSLDLLLTQTHRSAVWFLIFWILEDGCSGFHYI